MVPTMIACMIVSGMKYITNFKRFPLLIISPRPHGIVKPSGMISFAIIGHIAITFSISIELLHDQTWSSDHTCEDDRYTMKPRLQLTFDTVVLLVESDNREVIKTNHTIIE